MLKKYRKHEETNSELNKLIVSIADADKKDGGEGAIIIKFKNL